MTTSSTGTPNPGPAAGSSSGQPKPPSSKSLEDRVIEAVRRGQGHMLKEVRDPVLAAIADLRTALETEIAALKAQVQALQDGTASTGPAAPAAAPTVDPELFAPAGTPNLDVKVVGQAYSHLKDRVALNPAVSEADHVRQMVEWVKIQGTSPDDAARLGAAAHLWLVIARYAVQHEMTQPAVRELESQLLVLLKEPHMKGRLTQDDVKAILAQVAPPPSAPSS